MEAVAPNIIVEEDRSLRLVQAVLDPETPPHRTAAFSDYLAHDLPDFPAWRDALRAKVPGLYPARVKLVSAQEELRASLPGADAAIVENLEIRPPELTKADQLAVVQKFGIGTGNIDLAACRKRGVLVRTLRRRTNIAVAEHSMLLLLALAKQLPLINGLVTVDRLEEEGRPFRPLDTSQTANANWGRIGGLRTLHGSMLGVLGMGEIGAEMAGLGRGYGMYVLYHQRHRLSPHDEARLGVSYCTFDGLFARSDFLSIHVRSNAQTRDLVGRAALARMKRGAFLINTSRAEIVNRKALIEALESGHLGGAGFDVLHREPTTPDDPLLNHHNVILTPHLAGGSRLNGLTDLEEMLLGIWHELRPSGRAMPA